jgi:hypothetical protein
VEFIVVQFFRFSQHILDGIILLLQRHFTVRQRLDSQVSMLGLFVHNHCAHVHPPLPALRELERCSGFKFIFSFALWCVGPQTVNAWEREKRFGTGQCFGRPVQVVRVQA